MSRFGIWYDDGHIDCGWLAEEGRHGRQYRIERSTLEEAQEIAERQQQYEPETAFVAASFDEGHEALFKRVRKIVNRRRLEKAEGDFKRAKSAVAEDDEDTRTKFERTLDDE